MKPTVGRIVHFRQTADASCQAAIVVQVWGPETVNLVVFTDRSNDENARRALPDANGAAPLTLWATSIPEASDEQLPENSTWHWPEREKETP